MDIYCLVNKRKLKAVKVTAQGDAQYLMSLGYKLVSPQEFDFIEIEIKSQLHINSQHKKEIARQAKAKKDAVAKQLGISFTKMRKQRVN